MELTISDLIDIFIIILLCIIILLIWLTPVFCSRGNENSKKILWLTLFLGWIPFVWLVLLLSALLGKKKV